MKARAEKAEARIAAAETRTEAAETRTAVADARAKATELAASMAEEALVSDRKLQRQVVEEAVRQALSMAGVEVNLWGSFAPYV